MINLMELLETDTSVDWWNSNRQKLNEVITSYNDWQTIRRFDDEEKENLKTKIKLCREFGNKNHFSKWQYEILDDMESFVETVTATKAEYSGPGGLVTEYYVSPTNKTTIFEDIFQKYDGKKIKITIQEFD
jgi:hypothetical protein